MIWKRIISLLIVAVFVISGLAVVYNTPAKAQGEYVNKIELEVSTNREAVLGQVATGDLDVFLQSLEGSVYDSVRESWKEKLGTWVSEGSYNNLYLNPAHEPDTEFKYICDVEGEKRFNPFAVRKVRYAMNFLVNRQKMCQDLANGYANPRFIWLSSGLQVYEEYFKDLVEEEHGLTETGNKEKGLEMIDNALSNLEFNVDNAQLQKGDDGYWEFKYGSGSWKDIQTIGIHRTEDWRQDIGEYVAGLLDEAGIKVEAKSWDRTQAIPVVFDGDYDDLPWGYYTGGWLASGNVYYPEWSCSQMYAPWYGFMPTRAGEQNYQYENQTLDDLGQDLANGRVNTEEEYWSGLETMADVGLKESVRIFLTTETSYYVYDKDTVVGAATDAVTGWSDYFTPPTIQTTDGVLDLSQYSAEAQLYMDNWNKYGGSSGAYGAKQRRALHDMSSWNHPQSGLPMPVRENWQDGDGNIKLGYTYDEDGNLSKEIDVPSSAVDYNTAEQKWEEVGSGHKSAVKVTYDVVEGKWHDGHDMTVRDIMASYAFDKDMATDDNRTNDYYHATYSSSMTPWYNNIVGTEWNQDQGTFTIYGDYTFPLKDKVGSYFVKFPWLPYQVYESAEQCVAETDLASGIGPYTWDSAGEGNWVHWLSEEQSQDFKSVLQNMKGNWRPPYLKAENNAPITIDQSTYDSQLDQIITFINDYGHMYDSNGVFKLTEYDSEQSTMTMERFTQEDGYPWSMNHWAQEMQIATMVMGGISVDPQEATQAQQGIEVGNDMTVSVTGYIDEDFPTDRNRAVTPDDDTTVTLQLLNEADEVVVEETNPSMTEGTDTSTFEATFSTGDLDEGSYTLEASGQLGDEAADTSDPVTVYVFDTNDTGPVGLEVKSLSLDKSEVKKGNDIEATFEVENKNTTASKDISINVDGSEVETKTVPAGTTKEFTVTIKTDDLSTGDHTVEVGDQSSSFTVKKSGDNGGIPGFTFLIMCVSAVMAVAIYYRKERR